MDSIITIHNNRLNAVTESAFTVANADSRIPGEILRLLGGILTPEIVESGRKQYSNSRKESIRMEAKTIGKFIAALRNQMELKCS